MSFAQRLAECARQTEARLAEILDAPGAAVPSRLRHAMRDAVLNGGKRFRPFLVLEGAVFFDVAPAAALEVAAAVECIHCYSLVHDDLPAMDDDDLRRGRPTLHRVYDEWTAILAGDALNTLAFEILANGGAHVAGDVRARLVQGLATAAGRAGMVGGQCLDLEAEKLGPGSPMALGDVRRLQEMKTGALIAFAAEAGAILAQAEAAPRGALRRYGEALGLAFQIADDLLDVEGDVATVGKRLAKDAVAGKATFVSVLGREAARCRLAEAERQAIAALDTFDARADFLREAAAFASRRRH
jgi:farnesyl diphosphate synthase